MDINGLKSAGFNTEKALELIGGSKEVYQKIINTYYQNIESKISDIQEAFKNNDIKKYTIYVHALKSASRQIGADKLGEKAYYLEMCGKADNIEEIKTKTDDLINEYRNVGTVLEHFVTEKTELKPDKTPEKRISPALAKAKLLKLKQAAVKFDMDSVRKTIPEIENFAFNEEQSKIFRTICEGAKTYKYDVVAACAEGLLKIL